MTSRWTETCILEIWLGLTLIACGFHLIISDEAAIPIYGYGVMATALPPVKWAILMFVTGATQIVATMINGHGISWTPITRLICCSASSILMMALAYLKYNTMYPTTMAFSVFFAMAAASIWCGLIRANVVWERFTNDHGDN